MLQGGANWEAISTKPRPIGELIESIETLYLPMMRNYAAGQSSDAVISTSVETVEQPPSVDAVDPVGERVTG